MNIYENPFMKYPQMKIQLPEDSHYEQHATKKSIFSVCLCKDSSDHKCIRDEKTTYCRGVSSAKLGEAQASGPQWLRRLWFRWLDPIICQQLRFDWSSVRSDNFRLILIKEFEIQHTIFVNFRYRIDRNDWVVKISNLIQSNFLWIQQEIYQHIETEQ